MWSGNGIGAIDWRQTYALVVDNLDNCCESACVWSDAEHGDTPDFHQSP